MRKILFTLIILLLAGTMSCNKNASKPKSQSIEIRIENASDVNFTDIIFKDEKFGSLQPDHVSQYKSFEDVVAYPGAQIVIGKDTMWAGLLYCGTGPLPMLHNGIYTLKIFYDEEYHFYNSKFIEE